MPLISNAFDLALLASRNANLKQKHPVGMMEFPRGIPWVTVTPSVLVLDIRQQVSTSASTFHEAMTWPRQYEGWVP